MPRHQQVTICRKSDGPVSKHCSCEHCSLAVCSVCGGAEGTLTTDCPGVKIDSDRQQEVLETNLDYTDDRGWYLGVDGSSRRSPRFADTKLPIEPARVDPRTVVAPSIDWAAVDRTMDLQHKLTQKAIAWVISDRACEERSAALARIEDSCAALRGKADLDAVDRALLGTLEQEKISFQIACRNVERSEDEWKQLARRLVDTLEQDPVTSR